jgi:hypothetical protein
MKHSDRILPEPIGQNSFTVLALMQLRNHLVACLKGKDL